MMHAVLCSGHAMAVRAAAVQPGRGRTLHVQPLTRTDVRSLNVQYVNSMNLFRKLISQYVNFTGKMQIPMQLETKF